MKLHEGITQAYQNKWSFINTFTVQFDFGVASINSAIMSDFNNDSINLNIISVQTPEFSNAPIETWVGDRWRIQNSRDNVYRFSITFRDMKQMSLYESWVNIYRNTKYQYFDNVKFAVTIYKDADWYTENDKKFIILHETIVESVSGLTFNNDTQNQIAEFTVNFRCIAPIV